MSQSYLTSNQACAELGISTITLYKWISEGKIKAFREGRNYRFLPEDVARCKSEKIVPVAPAGVAA